MPASKTAAKVVLFSHKRNFCNFAALSIMLHEKLPETDNILGWITFAISATVFLLTIEPTASWWDPGEFISTTYKLQIGHPPGRLPCSLSGGCFHSLPSGMSQGLHDDQCDVGHMQRFCSAVPFLGDHDVRPQDRCSGRRDDQGTDVDHLCCRLHRCNDLHNLPIRSGSRQWKARLRHVGHVHFPGFLGHHEMGNGRRPET